MGRLRKDKGEKSKITALPPTKATDKPPKSKSGKGKGESKGPIQDHVRALGGSDLDIEMVKGVKDGMVVQGGGTEDPALSKDVSKFLSGLKLDASQGDKKGDRKQKEKAGKEVQKKVKDGDKKQTKPAAASAAAGKDQAEKKKQKTPREAAEKQEKKKAPPKAKVAKGSEPQASTSATALDGPSTSTSTLASAPSVRAQKTGKMLFPPSADWYNLAPPLPASASPVPAPTAAQIASLTSTASTLHASELAQFSSGPNSALVSSSSDQAFLRNILASGTLSDRLSALTLMVQSSPLHNTRALEVLKNMVEKGRGGGKAREGEGSRGGGGRDERLKAARAIVDWWIGGGAPKRKLKYFRDQPLLHPGVTNEHLLMWYFEDWLKKYFFSLLQVLEALSLDTLPYVRTQALTHVYTLLRECPEQEHNLLRLLVNKLGDTDKSICSRASHHLLQLLQAFPDMKTVVIRETTALVMRPAASTAAASSLAQPTAPKQNTHIKFDDDNDNKKKDKGKRPEPAQPQSRSTWNIHARYYATITFNQIVLSSSTSDRAAARALMDVYFQIFRDVVGERSSRAEGEGDEDDDDEEHQDKAPTAGKGVNKGRDAFNGPDGKKKRRGATKAVQGAAGFAEVQDANSRLVSAILTGVNRALPFARFGGADVEFERHMDTLFLICHTSTFNITLQALTLVQHVVALLPPGAPAAPAPSSSSSESRQQASAVPARYYRTLYATLLDPRLFTSNKQAMYLNLLYKSLKADPDVDRVKAFVKRLCQVLVGGFGGTEFVAGGLWLVGELFGNIPGLKPVLTQPPKEPELDKDAYDARKRDPQYANAQASALWELTPLLHHFHPTISLLARQLLTGQPLTSSPDLSLHTLTHFLDRFVYKNPKKLKPKGESAMQPVAADGVDGVRKLKGDLQETPVNEESWWRRNEASVPVDQLFFHKYFSQKHEREKAKADKVNKRRGKAEVDLDDVDVDAGGDVDRAPHSDGSDEDSDEEEAEIWKAMRASMPQVEGDNLMSDVDDDDDELPSDFNNDSDNDEAPDFDNLAEGDGESDDEEEGQAKAVESDEEEDLEGEAGFSLAEDSDADDLVDLDTDMPSGLIQWDGSDASADEGEEEWTGFSGGDTKAGKKRKREEDKSRRKKLRSLPTFASYDDYAKMIEDGPEDDV